MDRARFFVDIRNLAKLDLLDDVVEISRIRQTDHGVVVQLFDMAILNGKRPDEIVHRKRSASRVQNENENAVRARESFESWRQSRIAALSSTRIDLEL